MPQGECPYCVRVTCKHTVRRDGNVVFPCQWSGSRRRADAHRPCPWCKTTVGPFRVKPVYHRLSTICGFRPRWARS